PPPGGSGGDGQGGLVPAGGPGGAGSGPRRRAAPALRLPHGESARPRRRQAAQPGQERHGGVRTRRGWSRRGGTSAPFDFSRLPGEGPGPEDGQDRHQRERDEAPYAVSPQHEGLDGGEVQREE